MTVHTYEYIIIVNQCMSCQQAHKPQLKNGGFILAEKRKILICLSDALLKEMDSIVSIEKTNRSQFIREATKFYIREKKKLLTREKMKKGYQEMAGINLELAEGCLEADNETQQKHERRLAECD